MEENKIYNPLSIDVEEIKKSPDGILDISCKVNPGELGVDLEETKVLEKICVDAHLINTKICIVCSVNIRTKLLFKCSRCLEEFEREVRDNFQINFFKGLPFQIEAEEKEIELRNTDLSKDYYEDRIELADKVKEQLILLLPIKALCKVDCKGICATCGKNLNKESCTCKDTKIDLRWSELGKLLKEEKDGTSEEKDI
jgi:uncharacterized protein